MGEKVKTVKKKGTPGKETLEGAQTIRAVADLCKPCTVELTSNGATVKSAGGRAKKITCAKCGRRRFGVSYQITKEGTNK